MSTPRDEVEPTPRLVELSGGIYAYVQPDGGWYVNNAGLIVGSRGAVSIDTCATERRTRAYQHAIATVTDQPVRTVVNTHHHGDHTYGNYLFRQATIIAHERCRDAALELGLPGDHPSWTTEVEWGDLELEPPFLGYRDGVTLRLDDLRCEVRYVGTPAHTTNDSIVWIPDREVLFAGDLIFHGGTPFLLQGSLSGATRVLDEVLKPLGARVIVPGHGEVCGPEAIDETLAYLRFLRRTAEEGRRARLTPLAAARQADLGPFAALREPERLAANLHRAYAELDGAEPGAPIDLPAAILDMVTYHGGLLPSRA
ncbi:MBL fold metallo-hydrolase [Longimycelium tulufanense]|uniref:MBL fold metallo-hydrolase n=1 Tax=Longimycelium tulufanense TaxID=907463 RepID=A0A8J3CC48_9PSEU|nr:MBL fold metallo-hydrolase [Longimycelium tulufanense]GGM45781.1 MBL fold metallo-hydrolase [Longimycelium tulufanense]